MSLSLFGYQLSPSQLTRLAHKPQRCAVRLAAPKITCLCRLGSSNDRRRPPKPQQQRQPSPHPGRQPVQQLPQPLSRLLAGCSAAAASLFIPLLPSWASESFDYLADPSLDPSLAESPDILNTLLIVVVTYFTVMMLYLWLSSFLDEDADQSADDNNKQQQQQQPPGQSDLPPGYGSFLNAHVRSYVGPQARPVRALQALEQAEPLEGEDLNQLKGRLAAGAAEALDQQIRDCERLVRTKLLARKMGYTPSRAADRAASRSSSSDNGSQRQQHDPHADISALLSASVFTSPGGLSSPQHRAEIDALVEQHLDDLLPAGGGAFQDDLIVRQVMRRLVSHLVMEESLLLLEGVEHGKRALEEAGRSSKPGSKNWALW